MNHDIRPSWRRTFCERHPVLCECLSIIAAMVATMAVAYAVLYTSA